MLDRKEIHITDNKASQETSCRAVGVTKQIVHNILDISYRLSGHDIFHHKLPDTSHPHSPTYFLEIEGASMNDTFSLKKASFSVFLDLLRFQGTFFLPTKNQQRYMVEICEILGEHILSPVKGLGYFIGDISTIQNKDVFIDEYAIQNITSLDSDVRFSYAGEEYECLGFSSQAGPRRYRFKKSDIKKNGEDFWVTYKEFESIKNRVNLLPVSLTSKLDAISDNQNSNSKQLLFATIGDYTLSETFTDGVNSKDRSVNITKLGENLGEKISLRPVLFDLLEKLLNNSGEIFTPEKGESRYMQELIDTLPTTFVYRIKGLGYYIGNTPTGDELESAKLRLRLKLLIPLDKTFELSVGGVKLNCKGFSSQRGGNTYYFESSLGEIIPLPGTSFELLQRLVENPGVIVPVDRNDKGAVSGIRVAFGEEFLKRKFGIGIYIGTLIPKMKEISQQIVKEKIKQTVTPASNPKNIKPSRKKPTQEQIDKQKDRALKAKQKEEKRLANVEENQLKRAAAAKEKLDAHKNLMASREEERRIDREVKFAKQEKEKLVRRLQREENKKVKTEAKQEARLLAKQEKEKNPGKRKKVELELKSENRFTHISGSMRITTLGRFRIDGKIFYKLNINGRNKFIFGGIYNFLLKLKKNSGKYVHATEKDLDLFKRTNAIFKAFGLKTIIFYTPGKGMYYGDEPIQRNKIFTERQGINEGFHQGIEFLVDGADDWGY